MAAIVIAEIGENHYGRWDVCRGLVEEAAANGADIAKFQTYTAEQFGVDHEFYDWFKGVAMPPEVHFEMQALCKEKGLGFLSSPFTMRAAAFLIDKLGVDAVKIASGRIVHHDLLNYVNSRADQVRTVYMSTGASSMEDIRAAVGCLDKIERLFLLHCVSQYPAADENVNLAAMRTIKKAFPEHGVGYSDHSRGIDACVAAATLGAEVLEKHMTYHTRMPGDDHPGGMTPEMLGEMVRRIRRVEAMLGSPDKRVLPAEAEVLDLLRFKFDEVGFE